MHKQFTHVGWLVLASSLALMTGCTTLKRQPTVPVASQPPACTIHVRNLSAYWSHAAYTCRTAAATPTTTRVRNLSHPPAPAPEARLAEVNDAM